MHDLINYTSHFLVLQRLTAKKTEQGNWIFMFTSDTTNKCWCDCNWKENRHRNNDPNYFPIKWKKQHYKVRWSFYVPLSKNIRKWKTYLQFQAKNNISISIITSIDNKQFSILFLLQKNVLTKNLISARLVSKV